VWKFQGSQTGTAYSNGWNQNRESVYASSILKSNLPEFKIAWICQVAASAPEVVSAPVAQLDRACASEALRSVPTTPFFFLNY
jgi:hypothetical protein